MGFSHFDESKAAVMVDVSSKNTTRRSARACASVYMDSTTIELIKNELLPKGSPFEVARVAGIIAAKKTAELIPMCHPLMIEYINVEIDLNESARRVEISASAGINGKTGIEMEVLTAVSVAALTIYDMCKAVDKKMIISDIKLIEKSGGKTDFSV